MKTLASISRLHIVAIAAMGTFTFGWLFTGIHPWAIAGVCALDWFIVNLLNRVVDLEEDEANAIRGTRFVGRWRRPILVVGFGLLAASLVWVHAFEPRITALRVAYHCLGFAYNWPILPGRRRIKQLYFFKNFASACGFLITVFGYPLAAAGWFGGSPVTAPDVGPLTVVFAIAFFLPFELSYEVIYDLRDAPGDRIAGVHTYPVVHGEQVATRIIDGLIAGSLLAIALGYALSFAPWRLFVMGAAPLINLAWYKRAYRRGISSRDCVLLTWAGVALLVTYHVWTALGLPGSGVPS